MHELGLLRQRFHRVDERLRAELIARVTRMERSVGCGRDHRRHVNEIIRPVRKHAANAEIRNIPAENADPLSVPPFEFFRKFIVFLFSRKQNARFRHERKFQRLRQRLSAHVSACSR